MEPTPTAIHATLVTRSCARCRVTLTGRRGPSPRLHPFSTSPCCTSGRRRQQRACQCEVAAVDVGSSPDRRVSVPSAVLDLAHAGRVLSAAATTATATRCPRAPRSHPSRWQLVETTPVCNGRFAHPMATVAATRERRARTLWCVAPHCTIHQPSSTSPRLWRRPVGPPPPGLWLGHIHIHAGHGGEHKGVACVSQRATGRRGGDATFGQSTLPQSSSQPPLPMQLGRDAAGQWWLLWLTAMVSCVG